MDSALDRRKPGMPKLKFASGVITPMMFPGGRYHHFTSPFGSYSSANFGGSGRSLPNYIRSPAAPYLSKRPSIIPWSAVEMLEAVDDNVVVMDEVLVASATSGRKSRRTSLGPASGRGDAAGTGSSSSSPSSGNQNVYGNGHFDSAGNDCVSQVNMHHLKPAIGRSKISATFSPLMSKNSEAQPSTLLMDSLSSTDCSLTQALALPDFSSAGAGLNYVLQTNSLQPKEITPLCRPNYNTDRTLKSEHEIRSGQCRILGTLKSQEWSLIDDGIEVGMSCSKDNPPTIEGLAVLIQSVLYGPSRRNRLPVFCGIYPGERPPDD